ncbi:MAG: hypothetical protein EGS42_02580, partial [Coprococcus eutactus]|nr:hypothetical protein [Coprococcus eutactus]
MRQQIITLQLLKNQLHQSQKSISSDMRRKSPVSAKGRYGGFFLSWEQQYINLISEYGVTDV